MAETTYSVIQKAGRKWTVEGSGIASLKRDYIVSQNAVAGGDGEAISWTGIPAIGSAHPSYPGLYVSSYDVQEGAGADKKTLVVTVNYLPESSESGEGQSTCVVTEWGWDDGTDERELTTSVTGVAVVNSAGDPFDSVPKVMAPAPVFTKVMKFANRQSGWSDKVCTINNSSITIGGVTCPANTLLCTVSEKRLFGERMKYQYTVRLRYKSNLITINGGNTPTELGWNVSVVDAGMREITGSGTSATKTLIRVKDKETGKMCTVTSPALLNGSGGQLAEGGTPYNLSFAAYSAASFPNWFYSEPS